MTRRASVVVLALLAVTSASVSASPSKGVIFDQKHFSDAVPDKWKPHSDFDPCEFKRSSKNGRHIQHIYSGNEDKCPDDQKTNGAPKKGDVTIYRSYNANPGEVYKGWARGYIFNPHKARAVIKIIFFDRDADPRGLAECWDRTESSDSTVMETGQYSMGLHGNPDPEVTESDGCVAPKNTDGVSIHYRIHAIEGGASGKAVLQRLKFGRCKDDGDCSNVPGF